jgi:hypothetical protein
LLLKQVILNVVYENSLDDIVGYALFDLFKSQKISNLLWFCRICSWNIYIKDVNCLLKKEKKCSGSFRWVRGTSGIITIEDIVEELLEKWRWTRFWWRIDRKGVGRRHLYFSARFDVEYLNQTYKAIFLKVILWYLGRFLSISQRYSLKERLLP